MIVNLSVIVITIVSGLFFINGKGRDVNSPENRKNYILFISFILILQSGLRNVAVGADTYAYLLHFEKVKDMSWKDIFFSLDEYYSIGFGKDPGYLVFQKVIQYILPYYQLFLFAIAIIFFSALGNFIYKNTTRLTDAMFAFVLYSALFYPFFSITGHRQTIATAAALWSFELIKKQKLIPFLLLILIASTIHKSCLIFIPFYFLANAKNTKFYYSVVILLIPVLFYFKIAFNTIVTGWGGYENYEFYEGAGTSTFTTLLLLIAVLGWWQINPVIQQNNQVRKYYNAFILALIFTPLTWVNPSAMRVVQYFSIFMMLLVPPILQALGNKLGNLNKLVYTLALLMLILLVLKSQWAMEYKFFWQDMPLGENY